MSTLEWLESLSFVLTNLVTLEAVSILTSRKTVNRVNGGMFGQHEEWKGCFLAVERFFIVPAA